MVFILYQLYVLVVVAVVVLMDHQLQMVVTLTL